MIKVFDSSALIAIFKNEPGADRFRAYLQNGVISAVNAAEVVMVLMRSGMPLPEAELTLRKSLLEVREFSFETAMKTASLVSPQLRDRGISLGDRACMATALLLEAPVVTADRNWVGLGIRGLKVELIRE